MRVTASPVMIRRNHLSIMGVSSDSTELVWRSVVRRGNKSVFLLKTLSRGSAKFPPLRSARLNAGKPTQRQATGAAANVVDRNVKLVHQRDQQICNRGPVRVLDVPAALEL